MAIRSLTGSSEAKLQKELHLDKPFDTYEAFVAFDSELEDDDLNMTIVLFVTLCNAILLSFMTIFGILRFLGTNLRSSV